MGQIVQQSVHDLDGAFFAAHSDVEVHTVDLQPARRPLDAFHQLVVPLAGTALQGLRVGERMHAASHQGVAERVQYLLDLAHGGAQIVVGLRGGGAHTGDDLDGRQEQFVLGLGVFLGSRMVLHQGVDDLRRDRHEFARHPVDDPEFHLDAE